MATRGLSRWFETLLWLMGLVLATRLAFLSFISGGWVSGTIASLAGLVLFLFLRAAYMRARRPKFKTGLGIVEVAERELRHFGPFSGGALSVEELMVIEIETYSGDRPNEWVFTTFDGQEMRIEAGAVGADEIFDALEVLPGIRLEAASEALRSNRDRLFVIWQRPPRLTL